MKRKLILVATVVVAVIVGYMLLRPGSQPAVVAVQVSGGSWKHVFVRSSNFAGTKTFRSGEVVTVSPIAHGTYTVGVEYVNGQRVWAEFFHSDAGVRRRIDLRFEGDPSTGEVNIEETANGNRVLFKGKTTAAEAVESKPFRLDWI